MTTAITAGGSCGIIPMGSTFCDSSPRRRRQQNKMQTDKRRIKKISKNYNLLTKAQAASTDTKTDSQSLKIEAMIGASKRNKYRKSIGVKQIQINSKLIIF